MELYLFKWKPLATYPAKYSEKPGSFAWASGASGHGAPKRLDPHRRPWPRPSGRCWWRVPCRPGNTGVVAVHVQRILLLERNVGRHQKTRLIFLHCKPRVLQCKINEHAFGDRPATQLQWVYCVPPYRSYCWSPHWPHCFSLCEFCLVPSASFWSGGFG